MAVHVRYNSWCISLPSSAKQQREMTKSVLRCPENVNDDGYLFSPDFSAPDSVSW